MEDIILIIMLALLVCAGFAAILFFSGFLNKRKRKNNRSLPAVSDASQPVGKAELLDEFDSTGVMCFDKTEKPADQAER